MAVFDLQYAKIHFSELLERALNGEDVIIAKADKPAACEVK